MSHSVEHTRSHDAEQTAMRSKITKIFQLYYDPSSSDTEKMHHFVQLLFGLLRRNRVEWLEENFLKAKFSALRDDPMPLIIYKQLYYQQQFMKSGYSASQYANANANFADLFTLLRECEEPIDYQLPAFYVWNVIDQYISLYESFYYAYKDSDDPNVKIDYCWNELAMLNVLFSFIEKSRVRYQLEAIKKGKDAVEVAGKFGNVGVYKAFGYYSLIGLLRLYSSNGDYYQAIKSLEHISLDISDQKKFSGEENHCITTTFYYAGFCFLMTHRYIDAIKTLCEGMRIIFEVRTPECRENYNEPLIIANRMIMIQGRKMCLLLALALALFPYQVNEMILSEVKEVVGDSFADLQAADSATFRRVFLEACPRFYSLNLSKSVEDILHIQVNIFMMQVFEQRSLPPLRSRLSDYSSIPIQRLADLLHMSTTNTLELLLNLKHKMSLVDSKTDGSNGYVKRSLSDLDFYIAGDIVYVSQMKIIRHYGSNLVEYINTLSKMQRRTVEVLKKTR